MVGVWVRCGRAPSLLHSRRVRQCAGPRSLRPLRPHTGSTGFSRRVRRPPARRRTRCRRARRHNEAVRCL
eukprot:659988-Prymnesium_polylepis.1